MKTTSRFFLLSILFLCITSIYAQNIGQSSIITLVFPWGARSTGMGETFTGIADDDQAIFYNPAGLGQAPMANAWINYSVGDTPATELRKVAVSKTPGNIRTVEAWAWDSEDNLFKKEGNEWRDYFLHYLDSGETIRDIVNRFIDSPNSETVANAVYQIQKSNGFLDEKRAEIVSLLTSADLSAADAEAITSNLLSKPGAMSSTETVFLELLDYVDPDRVDNLSLRITNILRSETLPAQLFRVKVPYNIAINGEINDILVTKAGVLWVASSRGLHRFTRQWTHFTRVSGLPSDVITTLTETAQKTILVGTDSGAAIQNNGRFTHIAPDVDEVNKPVLTIAATSRDRFFIGNENGLHILSGTDASSARSITTEEGLFDNKITALFQDSRDRIWVGSRGGVIRIDGTTIERHAFSANAEIYDIDEARGGNIWFATNTGAAEFIETIQTVDGRTSTSFSWKNYHERNVLNSSHTKSISAVDDDIWLATSAGVEHYRTGDVRVSIFYEKLLPSLGLDDMWHAAISGAFPLGDWGSLGLFFNQIYFGEVPDGTSHSGTGQAGGSVPSSFEFTTGVSYGFPVRENFSLGVNLKYLYSRLVKDEAEAKGIAVDIALLRRNLFIDDLSLGFMIQNMGPGVSYSSDQKNPIPFVLRYGMSYLPINRPGSRLLVAFDLDREFVYYDQDKEYSVFRQIYKDLFDNERESRSDQLKKIIVHAGAEYTYADFIAVRSGLMFDEAGSRRELNVGLGANFAPMEIDFSIIFSLNENTVRQNQVRISATYAP